MIAEEKLDSNFTCEVCREIENRKAKN